MVGGSTRWRAIMAQRFLLIAGALLFLGGLFWLYLPFLHLFHLPEGNNSVWDCSILSTPAGWLAGLLPGGYSHHKTMNEFITITMYLGLFIFAQAIFLWPHGKWRLALAGRGRPLRGAAIGAGLMGMLLSIAFLATLMEIPSWLSKHPTFGRSSWMSLWTICAGHSWFGFTLLGVMPALWAVWAFVFFRYWRGANQLSRVERVIRLLIAGSILEVLVASAVQAFTPGNRNCYCAKGSYTGLVFGGTVLIWLFGPGILFVSLRKYQRRKKVDEPAAG